MDEISTIREFIRDQANVAPDDDLFSDEVDLLDYGYIDSFGIVALIEMIDQKYRVDLSDQDFYDQRLRTISGIASVVKDTGRARSS